MQHRPDITPNAITEWCVETFGSGPAATLFEGGHLSQVIGIELSNGRRIVVKAREWQDRLVACAQVQRALCASGFPAPKLLVGPDKWGDGYAISAEQLIEGGHQAPDVPGAARRFAEGLAVLVRSAPSPSDIGTLAPSPPWVGWDRADEALWPEPDDRDGDLNAHGGDPWLDDIARSVRARLLGIAPPCVVGHGDYHSQNVQWQGDELLAVHDWDSVVAQPEAAIVGQAAAVCTGGPGEVATVEQTEEFLDGYLISRGAARSKGWIEDSWAAGLWVRAFDAKVASLSGEDPFRILTPTEAQERMQRADLSTNQVNW
jgi:Phosphotransferase enzyme family